MGRYPILEKPITVLDDQGSVIAAELSVEDAAREMLGHDGHEYEVRPDEEGVWHLYVSQRSRNAHGGKGRLVSWPDYMADSEQGVYENVVLLGGVWGTTAMASDDPECPREA